MLAQTIVAIVFGVIIFVFACFTGIPQMYTMFKTRNTSGTSLATYIIFSLCPLACLSWGFLYFLAHMSTWWESHDLPLAVHQLTVVPMIATYILELFASVTNVVMKSRHILLAKRYNVTELQLSKILRSKFRNKEQQQIFPFVLLMIVAFTVTVAATALLTTLTDPKINPGVTSPDEGQMGPAIITLSILGAGFWEAMSWPQLVKCIRHKDTSGIAMSWAVFMPISSAICLVYAAILSSVSGSFTPDTIGSLIFNGVLVNLGILIIKLLNRKRARNLGLTEFAYTQKYLHKNKKKRA